MQNATHKFSQLNVEGGDLQNSSRDSSMLNIRILPQMTRADQLWQLVAFENSISLQGLLEDLARLKADSAHNLARFLGNIERRDIHTELWTAVTQSPTGCPAWVRDPYAAQSIFQVRRQINFCRVFWVQT